MAEMNKKIEQMLAEENTDGIILEINEQLLEEKNAVENLKSSLAEKTVKAVVVSEAETLFEEKVNVLYGLYESVKEQNIPVVVCGNAPTVRETVLSVIENKDVLTSHKLNRTMEQAGFELAETSDIVVEAVESKEDAARMNNSFTKYMDWAESFLEQEPVAQNYVRKYTAKEARPENTEERPFLTIVTRTQGKRPEALSEVLLSLMGQSCQDFELLVLGHKVEEERANKVKAIIEEVPEELRKRIQYVPVDYGNRTAPLNKGFELARGEYAVILDDDDLVLDNWVEKFKEKAETDYGKILHSYVIAQDWSAIKTENGEEMLRASGSPQNHFCRDFNILTELSGNYCPVLGLAFPTRPFQELNIRFDETLDTTEDWDFLMRMSTLCGVADIPVPTSIYRLWRNAENSQTLHNRAVWNENHLKIQKKFEKYPIFLNEAQIKDLKTAAEKRGELFDEYLRSNASAPSATMYINRGTGYNDDDTVNASSNVRMPDFSYEYTGLEKFGKIRHLRWDPYNRGEVYVTDLQIVVTLKSGKTVKKNMKQVSSNGFYVRNKIVILHSDPQIYFSLARAEEVSSVRVTGKIYNQISDNVYEYIAMAYDRNLIRRSKKFAKIAGKKVLKKLGRR